MEQIPKESGQPSRSNSNKTGNTFGQSILDQEEQGSLMDKIKNPDNYDFFGNYIKPQNHSGTGNKAQGNITLTTEQVDPQKEEVTAEDEPNTITISIERIAQYLEKNGHVIKSAMDLPVSLDTEVYIKVSTIDKKELFYQVCVIPFLGNIKILKKVDAEFYEFTKADTEKPLYTKDIYGSDIEIIVTGKTLEPVIVYAEDKKRLEMLRELSSNNNGFGGYFYNYPEEYAALLFASLNKVERNEIINDKSLLKQIGSQLDNAQYAKGLAKLDFTLKEKLDLLWEARGTGPGRMIEFQDLRRLLLSSGKEGEILHDKLAEVFPVRYDLRIDFLMDKHLLDRYIKAQGRYDTWGKPADLLFDDEQDDKKITLNATESKLVDNINKNNKTLNKLTEKEKRQYLAAFKRNALKITFEMLDISEKTVIESSNKLLKGEASDIFKALNSNKSSFEKMNKLDKVVSASGWGYDSKDTQQNKDFLTRVASEGRAEKAGIEQGLRSELSQEFPILSDTKIDLQDLYNDYGVEDDETDLKEYLTDHLGEVFNNIQETRRIIREKPDQVYKLQGVMEMTKQRMGLPSSVYEEIVDEKIAQIEWDDFMFSIGLAIVSIGLAIASFGTLSPLASAIVLTSSLATSGVDFYYTYENYRFEKTTGHTSINSKEALSVSDPSIIWVIASFAGAVADVVSVAKVLKAAKLIKFAKTGEGAADIAAELKALGVITKGMNEADIIALLNKARKLKSSVKEQLIHVMQGKSIDLKHLDELSDLYMAENFGKLDDLGKIDDFIKKDIPKWYDSKINKKIDNLDETKPVNKPKNPKKKIPEKQKKTPPESEEKPIDSKENDNFEKSPTKNESIVDDGITSPGEMLGDFGIPKYYTYTFEGQSVFIHPHAMKHLEELAANGKKLGPDYLKLLGQTHQKSLHSAINDVLSRGPIKYREMYYSGGNEIMFGAPKTEGLLPAVIHFR